ncbi:unnamed protein product [Heligmosomoides polygyrus]|uniref:Protein TEX261 n=1 Tax=Heligmosomoides polygyrus TaxID=6339 RepID=A0A183FUG9_HELPZ|nr:unnamed protein product [Heligmosomoides polygyrus]
MSAPVTTLMTFLFGVLNVTLASFFVILTVIVGVGIRLVDGYSKWTSYQIMLSISFFESVQLISHLFSGITLLVNCEMPIMLSKVIFVLTYAVFPFFAGLQWMGLASYAYQKERFSWDYDFSLPLSRLCDNIGELLSEFF